MFNTSIKREVMKVISQRIKNVQKEHDLDINNLAVDYKDSLVDLKNKHQANKEDITRKHVNNILGDII